jgi:hypothetical protein
MRALYPVDAGRSAPHARDPAPPLYRSLMNRRLPFLLAWIGLALLAIIALLAYSPSEEEHLAAINETLDAFHAAAAEADLDGYFDLLAADARFLGTDATERWTRSEFHAYALERGAFDEAPAWVYAPSARDVALGPAKNVAWFDEILTHERYGTLRGSGVLTRTLGANWKIAQYNLTFLVPNEKAAAVVEAIASPLPEDDGAGVTPSRRTQSSSAADTPGDASPR